MTADVRQAFAALRLDWTLVSQDVWKTSTAHVDGLHEKATLAIELGIREALACTDTSPQGVVIRGLRGTGKTHLMGWVREQAHAADAYFFLVGPLSGVSLWRAVASAFRRDLARPVGRSGTQLDAFLERLSVEIDAKSSTRDAILGRQQLTPDDLDDLVLSLRQYDRILYSDCQDTLRALVLYNSPQRHLEDVGKGYLLSQPELESGERATWGIRELQRIPNEVVGEITRLLSITGACVIAFDQVDSISAETQTVDGDVMDAPDTVKRNGALDQVADGLVVLRDVSARTLTVLSCLPATWILLEEHGLSPVMDRFRTPVDINNIGSPEAAAALVTRRFDEPLRRVGYARPYVTWPVREAVFASVATLTPRRLFQRIDEHVSACLESNKFAEIVALNPDGSFATASSGAGDTGDIAPADQAVELAALDRRFKGLCDKADIEAAFDGDSENVALPPLLMAGLAAWVQEQGDGAGDYTVDPLPGPRPDLHARLTLSVDDATGAEKSWSFRGIASAVTITALYRLRAACEASGIEEAPSNKLFILRDADWNPSPKTTEAKVAFEAAGGTKLPLDRSDLAVFAALRELLDQPSSFLQDWLLSRRPATLTQTLRVALRTTGGAPPRRPSPTTPTPTGASPEPSDVVVGSGIDDVPTTVSLQSLRRHTVIFAGSGSGKTVLIRRLVEECALRGVSSIVLDPNNDLARLGEAWPAAPDGWRGNDRQLANEYLANTEVVIWTPRRSSGRPLSFQPLPAFSSVVDDEEELDAAIDAATATLASRISLGTGNRARVAEAVLRESLRHYANHGGGGDLQAFLDLLADLPDGVTSLDPNGRIALGLAQALRAAVINDPLFGGRGEAADPGVLLTPSLGKRARVSVISLIGLTSDDQKQSFVNQLQMGLFAWIKKHPADDKPLVGLLVMDEAQNFAPANGKTVCTSSTLALVAQARKYGLGLVFATQQPRGLHNHIPGNSATQFFGRLNAPVQIATAQEMARTRGGDASEVGRLKVANFYITTDDLAFRRLTTPLCLSYHGRPLTEAEVLERSRKDR